MTHLAIASRGRQQTMGYHRPLSTGDALKTSCGSEPDGTCSHHAVNNAVNNAG